MNSINYHCMYHPKPTRSISSTIMSTCVCFVLFFPLQSIAISPTQSPGSPSSMSAAGACFQGLPRQSRLFYLARTAYQWARDGLLLSTLINRISNALNIAPCRHTFIGDMLIHGKLLNACSCNHLWTAWKSKNPFLTAKDYFVCSRFMLLLKIINCNIGAEKIFTFSESVKPPYCCSGEMCV